MNKAYFKRDVKTVKNLLKRALYLIESVGWTKGISARTKDRKVMVDPDAKNAGCFCLLGAILASSNNGVLQAKATDKLRFYAGQLCLAEYNDSSKSKKRIVNLLNLGIRNS